MLPHTRINKSHTLGTKKAFQGVLLEELQSPSSKSISKGKCLVICGDA